MTLEHCSGTKEKTAEVLGVSVKTFYNRLRQYGVQQLAFAGPILE